MPGLAVSDDAADDDAAMRRLVADLARPHPSGGHVVERAALLSSGDAFKSAVAWIQAHGGQAEFAVARAGRSGMYSVEVARVGAATPLRFILPAGALRHP